MAVRVVVSGRVQGVGYRAWTVATASSFGLKGWVRNVNDGTVEAVFHGHEDTITSMLEACRQGPPAAHVTDIRSHEWEEDLEETRFIAKATSHP